MKYFDAHTHLHDAAFETDREEVYRRMRDAQVSAVTVGTDLSTSKAAVAFAESHEQVWSAIGLHPNDNARETFDAEAYSSLVAHPSVVAIGECGLDYFRGKEDDKDRQRQQFVAQIAFAVEHDKPLMIHCRDAHDDVVALLSEAQKEYGEKVRGIIHFFTAGPDVARRYLNLGFYLSFPGVVTFTPMYDESVRLAPPDRILTETDAPYAAPAPHRGKRNEPSYVRFTVQRVAELKGMTEEALVEQVQRNAAMVFNLPFA